jgi:hypothetical protein
MYLYREYNSPSFKNATIDGTIPCYYLREVAENDDESIIEIEDKFYTIVGSTLA